MKKVGKCGCGLELWSVKNIYYREKEGILRHATPYVMELWNFVLGCFLAMFHVPMRKVMGYKVQFSRFGQVWRDYTLWMGWERALEVLCRAVVFDRWHGGDWIYRIVDEELRVVREHLELSEEELW